MKTLVRIYLVVIFAGSAVEAGSVNETMNSGLSLEVSNLAKTPSHPVNLQGMAECFSYSIMKDKAIEQNIEETVSEGNTYDEMSHAKK